MSDTTRMTEQDLIDAHPFADQILSMTVDKRGPTVVAGIALALAGAAHLAGCGPNAARLLFERYYNDLERAKVG